MSVGRIGKNLSAVVPIKSEILLTNAVIFVYNKVNIVSYLTNNNGKEVLYHVEMQQPLCQGGISDQ